MIQIEDNPENSILPNLVSPLSEPRGQIEFCKKINCKFIRIRRQSVQKKISRCKNQKTASRLLYQMYMQSHIMFWNPCNGNQITKCFSYRISHSNRQCRYGIFKFLHNQSKAYNTKTHKEQTRYL